MTRPPLDLAPEHSLGTAQDAIDFIVAAGAVPEGQERCFLEDWTGGRLDRWPRFRRFLAMRRLP